MGGFVIGVFGKPLFKPVIFVVGTVVFVLVVSMLIFSLFFDRDTEDWLMWLIFTLCVLVGGVAGFVLAKLSRLGAGVLAGWGGFCLGLILYNSFLYKADDERRIVFWVFNISLAILAGITSIFLFNHALIIGTSIIGAYGFVRGISMYAGGFPDEMELVTMIKYQQMSGIDNRFYGYMIGFIVAAISCTVL